MGAKGATIISELVQLIYASQPFGYDSAMLSGILLDARRCNARDGITGALICRADIYLQLLEGPEPEVRAAFDRIRKDDRHIAPKLLVNRPVTDRIFGDWAMLHDPANSWIWSKEDIHNGILDRIGLAEVVELFETLAEKSQNASIA